MNIFTDDTEKLRHNIDEIQEKIYTETKTKELCYLYAYLDQLLELYYSETIKKDLDNDTNFVGYSYKYYQIEALYKKMDTKFFNNFICNKENHFNLLVDSFQYLDSCDFLFDKDYNTGKPLYLSDRQCLEILDEFFKNKSDKSYDVFHKMIDENLLFDLNDDHYDGFSFYGYKNQPHRMSIAKPNNDLKTLNTIVHEMGHIMEFINIKNTQGEYNFRNYQLNSIFIEVLSTLNELQFLDFLTDNNIGREEVLNLKKDLYFNQYYFIGEVITMCNIPDEIIMNNNYQKYSKSELEEYAFNSSKQELSTENDDYSRINLVDSLCYGYGGFLSTIINHQLKENPDHAKKILSTLRNNQIKKFDINIFDNMGLDGKNSALILQKELKRTFK